MIKYCVLALLLIFVVLFLVYKIKVFLIKRKRKELKNFKLNSTNKDLEKFKKLTESYNNAIQIRKDTD